VLIHLIPLRALHGKRLEMFLSQNGDEASADPVVFKPRLQSGVVVRLSTATWG